MAYIAKTSLRYRRSPLLVACACSKSNRSIPISNRHFATETNVEKPKEQQPLKFSESAGYARRRPDMHARGTPTASPLTFWESMETKGKEYQIANSFAFGFSTIVFMIYFLVLREENDLDEELSKPLWERLPSLEEQVLHERIILGKHKGEDVSQYEKRYQELQQEKQREFARVFKHGK